MFLALRSEHIIIESIIFLKGNFTDNIFNIKGNLNYAPRRNYTVHIAQVDSSLKVNYVFFLYGLRYLLFNYIFELYCEILLNILHNKLYIIVPKI